MILGRNKSRQGFLLGQAARAYLFFLQRSVFYQGSRTIIYLLLVVSQSILFSATVCHSSDLLFAEGAPCGTTGDLFYTHQQVDNFLAIYQQKDYYVTRLGRVRARADQALLTHWRNQGICVDMLSCHGQMAPGTFQAASAEMIARFKNSGAPFGFVAACNENFGFGALGGHMAKLTEKGWIAIAPDYDALMILTVGPNNRPVVGVFSYADDVLTGYIDPKMALAIANPDGQFVKLGATQLDDLGDLLLPTTLRQFHKVDTLGTLRGTALATRSQKARHFVRTRIPWRTATTIGTAVATEALFIVLENNMDESIRDYNTVNTYQECNNLLTAPPLTWPEILNDPGYFRRRVEAGQDRAEARLNYLCTNNIDLKKLSEYELNCRKKWHDGGGDFGHAWRGFWRNCRDMFRGGMIYVPRW